MASYGYWFQNMVIEVAMSTLFRLIAREVLPPLFIAVFGLCLLMVLGQMLPLLEPLFRARATLMDLVRLVPITLPVLASFAIPMAVLIGVLTGYMKLSRDGEMIALFSVGVSPLRLIMPVLALSLLMWALVSFLTVWAAPRSKAAVRRYVAELTQRTLARGLPDRIFFSPARGLTLYIEDADSSGKRFSRIYVNDARKGGANLQILARKGSMLLDSSGEGVIFDLEDGFMTQADRHLSATDTLFFSEYVLKVRLGEVSVRTSRGQMATGELLRRARSGRLSPKKRARLLSEFHKRIAMPFATIILGLMGVPLGIFFGTTGLAGGISIGISSFLGYYICLAFFANLGESGAMPPSIALWMPNVIVGGVTAYLLFLLFKKGPVRWG